MNTAETLLTQLAAAIGALSLFAVYAYLEHGAGLHPAPGALAAIGCFALPYVMRATGRQGGRHAHR